MWTLELFRTVSGDRFGELPNTDFTWTSKLRDGHLDAKPDGLGTNEVKGISFSIDALNAEGWIDRSSPDWQGRLIDMFMPRKNGIMVLYNGIPIEGGPIGQSVTITHSAVEVSVDSMMSVFDSRYLVPESFSPKKQIAVNQRSLGTLAREAMRYGMAKPSGSMPIELPAEVSGSRSQVWKSFNIAKLQVSETVQYLADMDGGPDIALRPKVASENKFAWEFIHGSLEQPHLGQATVHDWEEGSPDVGELRVLLSTSTIAHRVYAVGGGNDVSTPIQKAETNVPRDWPLVERVVVDSSISAVPDQKEWKKTAAEANADAQAAADAAQAAYERAQQKAQDANSAKTTSNSVKTTVSTTVSYIWPFPLASVSSEYGPRPGVGKGYHDGIDFAQPRGAAIPAIADGTVTAVGIHSDAGPYAIDIDHGGGVHSQYWHCSAKLVSAGQSVKRGQTIGRVGTLGLSFGNHLHLEIHAPGSPSGRSTWPPRDFMASRAGGKSAATVTYKQAESASQKAATAARNAANAAKKKAETAKKKAAEALKAAEKEAEKAATIKQRAWAAEQLSGIAKANVNKWPMLQLSLDVRADGTTPLGTFWPGEVANLTVHDHPALSEGTYALRILEMSGSNSESVNLVFEPVMIQRL